MQEEEREEEKMKKKRLGAVSESEEKVLEGLLLQAAGSMLQ